MAALFVVWEVLYRQARFSRGVLRVFLEGADNFQMKYESPIVAYSSFHGLWTEWLGPVRLELQLQLRSFVSGGRVSKALSDDCAKALRIVVELLEGFWVGALGACELLAHEQTLLSISCETML